MGRLPIYIYIWGDFPYVGSRPTFAPRGSTNPGVGVGPVRLCGVPRVAHVTRRLQRRKYFKNLPKKKNNLACNPDSGPAIVLSAPRSACLASFQLAGASGSLQGSNLEKA